MRSSLPPPSLRHQGLARRFVRDPRVSCNLVFDPVNNELWWFSEEKLYFISSKSANFVLEVRVFVKTQRRDARTAALPMAVYHVYPSALAPVQNRRDRRCTT